MNKHIEVVKKWLADADSVTLQELRENHVSAYNAYINDDSDDDSEDDSYNVAAEAAAAAAAKHAPFTTGEFANKI